MGFGDAVRSGFSNYVNFEGRASRSEYWWWIVFTILAALVASILELLLGLRPIIEETAFGPLYGLVTIALFLPTLAVAVRRLHDTDRSGWWYLLILIPLIGMIVLIVFLASSGTPGPNRFGPPPGGAGMTGRYDMPMQR